MLSPSIQVGSITLTQSKHGQEPGRRNNDPSPEADRRQIAASGRFVARAPAEAS